MKAAMMTVFVFGKCNIQRRLGQRVQKRRGARYVPT